MSDGPEQIAARLSPAQRKAMIAPGRYARGERSTIRALWLRGLVHDHAVYVGRLTDIGEAVRAVLEAQKP